MGNFEQLFIHSSDNSFCKTTHSNGGIISIMYSYCGEEIRISELVASSHHDKSDRALQLGDVALSMSDGKSSLLMWSSNQQNHV